MGPLIPLLFAPKGAGTPTPPWAPTDLAGLVAAPTVELMLDAGQIWQDVAMTTPATTAGHVVRAIEDTFSAKTWTNAGTSVTLRQSGGKWLLRHDGTDNGLASTGWQLLTTAGDVSNYAMAYAGLAVSEQGSLMTDGAVGAEGLEWGVGDTTIVSDGANLMGHSVAAGWITGIGTHQQSGRVIYSWDMNGGGFGAGTTCIATVYRNGAQSGTTQNSQPNPTTPTSGVWIGRRNIPFDWYGAVFAKGSLPAGDIASLDAFLAALT